MSESLLPGLAVARRWAGSREVLAHLLLAVAALATACALPAAAELVLHRWWPRVAVDADLLVASEIALATVLLAALNLTRGAWASHGRARVADAAALVYAREDRGYFARRRERRMLRRLAPPRDACVLALSGFDTFAAAVSPLNEPLAQACEIRVLLLNPLAAAARRRIDALPPEVTLDAFAAEVEASVAFLSDLRRRGSAVTLRFYEHEPLWKVAVLGDHAWVQHCRRGSEVKHEPEYVFALDRSRARRGLFEPFYRCFLDEWHDPAHPYYDFNTGDLVYRDPAGRELRRQPLRAGCAGRGRPTASPAPQHRPRGCRGEAITPRGVGGACLARERLRRAAAGGGGARRRLATANGTAQPERLLDGLQTGLCGGLPQLGIPRAPP